MSLTSLFNLPSKCGQQTGLPVLLPALLCIMNHVLSHLQHDHGGLHWISVHLSLLTLPLVVLGLSSFSCEPALMSHLLIYQDSNILLQLQHLPHNPAGPYRGSQTKGFVLVAYMVLSCSGSIAGN